MCIRVGVRTHGERIYLPPRAFYLPRAKTGLAVSPLIERKVRRGLEPLQYLINPYEKIISYIFHGCLSEVEVQF